MASDSIINAKNVILFSDAKASSSAHTGLLTATLPNYMQPIQQKFKKQTIQMVKEKEAEVTAAPKTSASTS